MHPATVELFEPWTARDGAVLTIRPILPADARIERAFVDGLSYRTGYQRLLSPRRLSHAEIEHFTHIDYAREMALVAIDATQHEDAMVGVARYVRSGADAEFAIVLADAWQGRGLGRTLMDRLIAIARREGVTMLSDITLASNAGMLGLARELGFRLSREVGDATLTRMSLAL